MHEGEASPSCGIVSIGFACCALPPSGAGYGAAERYALPTRLDASRPCRAGRFPLTPCPLWAQGTGLRSAPRCPRPYSLRSLHVKAQHLRRKTSPVTFVQNEGSFCTRPSTLSMAGDTSPSQEGGVSGSLASFGHSVAPYLPAAAFVPAIWPNTQKSTMALPPRRLPPWMLPVISPAQ